MTDRELLEAAAKAAGLNYTKPADGYDGSLGLEVGSNPMRTQSWNPLTDDGDALRLAVKLGLSLGPSHGATYATIAPCPDDFEDGKFPVRVAQMHNDDPYTATRRAIVRAAAEIGRNMT